MHGVPEPAVIQRRRRDPGEPVTGGGPPPVREPEPGARRDQPVQRRQRQVGAGGKREPGRPGPAHLVDDLGRAQIPQHPPGRGHVPERQVPGPLRQHRGIPGPHRRRDLGRGAPLSPASSPWMPGPGSNSLPSAAAGKWSTPGTSGGCATWESSPGRKSPPSTSRQSASRGSPPWPSAGAGGGCQRG